ncbi:hypothetical protein TWF703_010939 [Orbilia oligospora]|uniref:37S ribosomal protein YMR-31, mitochondrial n=1 Tax=Orbilia oligospora TaxID=2813651 RepID=A0A7C8NM38_ORBOL|nr:hypothetical protein TWF703_010939 [Orbilia oligospora]
MNPTRVLARRTPLIHFIGKRSIPEAIDHTPLANQHGPLATRSASSKSYFSPAPPQGQFFDRSELPARFGRLKWSSAEIDAVESGGANLAA